MSSVLNVYDLGGKVAFVTGAATGIGAATAKMLAAVGATVVCADIDAVGCEATAADIRSQIGQPGSAEAVELDVTDGARVAAEIDATVKRHGRLDILANIAGIMINASVDDTSEADLDRAWAVNFKGVFFPSQAAARHMQKNGSGSIINMASSSVDVPTARYTAYSATKDAVIILTQTMAMELGPFGVRVNAVAPAFVNTRMTARHYTREDGTIDVEKRAEVLARTRELYPLRLLAEPEDIAHVVLFLACDAARVFTGQTIRPNAGITMR
jgi:3-oxoacyl-[acyl-carrier protein] reductase